LRSAEAAVFSRRLQPLSYGHGTVRTATAS